MDIVTKPEPFRWPRGPKFRFGPGLLIAIVVCFAAFALATARPGNPALYPTKDRKVVVYLIDNGFHTDIALMTEAVIARGGPLAEVARQTTSEPWVAVGWGDADFYRQTGINGRRAADGFRALFAKDNPSAVRAFGISRHPLKAYDKPIARAVTLSPEGYEAMLRRMEASMSLTGGAPVRLASGYNPDEVFFKSGEVFSFRRLCNNWTADMLAAAGLPTMPAADGIAPLFLFNLSWRADVKGPR